MRSLPVLCILAVVVMVSVSGCDKSRSAWVGIEELKPPKEPNIRAGQLSFPGADIRSHAVDVEAQRWKSLPDQHKTDAGAASRGASDEIGRRIDGSAKDWKEYIDRLSSQPLIYESDTKPAQSTDGAGPATGREDDVALISPAVRRNHAEEYVNLQLRIAILEKRMASAGEPEQKSLAAKLEQAKAEMKALDAVCKEESGQTYTKPSADKAKVQPAVQR